MSLDLLTYDDLRILRERKLGATGGHHKRKQTQDSKLKSKRYLIMTYTVEFDQIHYPLPLTFTGNTDPRSLKKQIKELKNQNRKLRAIRKNTSGSDPDYDFEKLLEENQELKEEVENCHQQLKDFSADNINKELKILKKVVQNLEVSHL